MSCLSKFIAKTRSGFFGFLVKLIDGEPVDSGEYLYTRRISLVDPSEIKAIPINIEQAARQEGIEIGKQLAAVESFLNIIERDARKIGNRVKSELGKNQYAEWEEAMLNIRENVSFVRAKLNSGNLDVELSKRLLLLNLKNLKEWNKKAKGTYFNCRIMKLQYKNVITILDQIAPKINSFNNQVVLRTAA